MFAGISRRYDLANDVLSFGQHRQWRQALVRIAGLPQGAGLLDCAAGTGDIAISFKHALGEGSIVVATDFCPEMLKLAKAKFAAAGLTIAAQYGDMLALPFPDGAFDAATCGFGIRNLDDPARGVAEMARTVVPGGQVLILEFGQPRGAWGRIFSEYSRHVLPPLGGLLTGSGEAYQYLHKTSAAFPCAEDFVKLMQGAASFGSVEMFPLTGGVAYIYRGVVAR